MEQKETGERVAVLEAPQLAELLRPYVAVPDEGGGADSAEDPLRALVERIIRAIPPPSNHDYA